MIGEIVATLLAGYAVIGVAFGLACVLLGIGRADPAAAGSPIGFRLLVLPGAAVLWPLLAWRWARSQGPPPERGPHQRNATP